MYITASRYLCGMSATAMASPRPARIAVGNFFFVSGLCFASWAARIPDIQHKLSLSEAGLGTVLLAAPVGSMLCLPLAGWLVTRLGSRAAMLTGTICYCAVLCLIGLVQSTLQLVGALFLFGLFGNLMNISVNTQAVGVESLYQRSIMASFHGLWSLAGFTAAAIGTMMVNLHIIPFHHFLVIAGIILLTAAIFFHKTLPYDSGSSAKAGLAWPDKSLFRLGVVSFCCMVCEGCMFDWSGIYFRDVVRAPDKLVTVGYTTYMATMATGRFIADYMVTRFGVKKVLQISGILIAAGLLISVAFPTVITAAIGFFLTGFGVSSVVPLVYGLSGKSSTMPPGMAIAAVSTVGFLGFLFGPPLIGYIAQALDLRWSFALMALLGFGTTLMAGKVSPR